MFGFENVVEQGIPTLGTGVAPIPLKECDNALELTRGIGGFVAYG